MTGHSEITSINNFTLAMRRNLAQSIGLDQEVILTNRDITTSRGILLHYYDSLTLD